MANALQSPALQGPWATSHAIDLDAVDAENMPSEASRSGSKPACYARILDVFPDLSLKYLEELYNTHSPNFAFDDLCITIIEQVMSHAKYPKQKDELAKEARERDTVQRIETQQLQVLLSGSQFPKLVEQLMRQEFPNVTVENIKASIKVYKTVDKVHQNLTHMARLRSEHANARPLKKRRLSANFYETFPRQLVDHVNAQIALARHAASDALLIRPTEPAMLPEQAENETVECGCCFADTPASRTTYCSGDTPHFFCFDCTLMLTKTDIGQARCRPQCMHESGCEAPFAEHQLRLCLDQKTMDHLIRLRQQDDLRAAEIDGLEDCPFCDFMDVCRSVDVDREFRCQNDECGIVSCRLCHQESHVPITCEKAAEEREKDKKIDARHVLEEEMTKALIRTCNRDTCKTKFVKTDGCNSMHCPKCANHQCYVCSKTISGYEHFGAGKCELHDPAGVESRHKADVEKAETAAKARIRAEKPEIEAGDLEFKLSDAVREQEARIVGTRPQAMRRPGLDAVARGQLLDMEGLLALRLRRGQGRPYYMPPNPQLNDYVPPINQGPLNQAPPNLGPVNQGPGNFAAPHDQMHGVPHGRDFHLHPPNLNPANIWGGFNDAGYAAAAQPLFHNFLRINQDIGGNHIANHPLWEAIGGAPNMQPMPYYPPERLGPETPQDQLPLPRPYGPWFDALPNMFPLPRHAAPGHQPVVFDEGQPTVDLRALRNQGPIIPLPAVADPQQDGAGSFLQQGGAAPLPDQGDTALLPQGIPEMSLGVHLWPDAWPAVPEGNIIDLTRGEARADPQPADRFAGASRDNERPVNGIHANANFIDLTNQEQGGVAGARGRPAAGKGKARADINDLEEPEFDWETGHDFGQAYQGANYGVGLLGSAVLPYDLTEMDSDDLGGL